MEEAFNKTDANLQTITTIMAKRSSDSEDHRKVMSEIRSGFSRMEAMMVSLMNMVSAQSREREERTILVKIHLEWYPISCEVLNQVFSEIGNLESIGRLSPEDEFHSRIRFQDRESAVRALEFMNLKYIYAGCCRMELFLEAEIVDRTSEIEISNQKTSEESVIDELGKQASDFTVGNELQGCQEDTEAIVVAQRSHETDEVPKDIGVSVHQIVENSGTSDKVESLIDDLSEEIDPSKIEAPIEALRQDFEFEAISESSTTTPQLLVDRSEAMTVEIYALEDESVKGSAEPYSANEISKSSVALNPFECESSNSLIVCIPVSTVQLGLESNSLSGVLEIPKRSASKVFAKMTDEKVVSFESKTIVGQSISGRNLALRDGTLIFDPGIVKLGVVSSKFFKVGALTDLRRESGVSFLIELDQLYAQSSCFDGPKFVNEFPISMPFDRGKVFAAIWYVFPFVSISDVCTEVDGKRLQWDPGILNLRFRKGRLLWPLFSLKNGMITLLFLMIAFAGGFVPCQQQISALSNGNEQLFSVRFYVKSCAAEMIESNQLQIMRNVDSAPAESGVVEGMELCRIFG